MVDINYLVTFLIRTFVIEWYVVWCGSTFEREWTVCTNVITILGFITNLLLGTYMTI